MQSVFTFDGQTYAATPEASGPWSSDMLQGSATTGLLVREVEHISTEMKFEVRRISFDLWRPARLSGFAIRSEVLRKGNSATTIQVGLIDAGTEVARCTALLARPTESPTIAAEAALDDLPPEMGRPPPPFAQKWSRYFQNVSARLVEGELQTPGPAAAWLRLDIPLVNEERNSPLIQAVQAADFASGISQVVNMQTWSFINPELTLHLSRTPRDSWILVKASTLVGSDGGGVARASLFDSDGPFGGVMQSVIFQRRASRQSSDRK